LQNALGVILGPGGLDALRNLLYRSRLGTSLIRGQLKYVVPGIAAVAVVVFIGLLLMLRSHF
jgi:hypothetical protein